jgi:uncharacterized protein GlcG (DUF336 family)
MNFNRRAALIFVCIGAGSMMATATTAAVPASVPPEPATTEPTIVQMPKLSWRLADRLAAEAVAVCQGRGVSVTATIVDSTGQRQTIVKGDTVGPHSLSLSYRKAFTAYAFADSLGMSSSGEVVRSGKMSAGTPALNTVPDLIMLAGGVAIRAHGKTLLGALGVSGASSGNEDEACAAEALARHQAEIDR